MSNYLYQPTFSHLSYPPPVYPPPMSAFYSYPPPANEQSDTAFDFYNPGYSSVPYPAYPIYYSAPSALSVPAFYNPTPRIKNLKDEIDGLTDKRGGLQNRSKNNNSMSSSSSAPKDLNPEALKNMLYDTLQQEMSALEVLKQQIASFTLLSHNLEQSGRSRSYSGDVESTIMGKGLRGASSSIDLGKNASDLPQFDSTPPGSYVPPGQNMKSPLASTNFLHPPPFFSSPYHFPPTLQEQQYTSYAYPMQFNSIPEMNGQPSFVSLSAPTSLPMDLNSYPSRSISAYATNFRRAPANIPKPPLATEAYHDPFHDLAIKTLYDVENKLREAEETIAEKINEFETEVSAQSGAIGMAAPPLLPMTYNPYAYPPYPPYPTFDSVQGNVTAPMPNDTRPDVNASTVKDLAVRALRAIDRRLRVAERTIGSTVASVSNFDGMGGGRAVKSPTREIGVQTIPATRMTEDSDTDDSPLHSQSESN